MDERRKTALRQCHQRLRDGITVMNVLPALRPVLTDVEYSCVSDRRGNKARVDELLKILITKENMHFDRFRTALEENGYEHWAETLTESMATGEGKQNYAYSYRFVANQFMYSYLWFIHYGIEFQKTLCTSFNILRYI